MNKMTPLLKDKLVLTFSSCFLDIYVLLSLFVLKLTYLPIAFIYNRNVYNCCICTVKSDNVMLVQLIQ